MAPKARKAQKTGSVQQPLRDSRGRYAVNENSSISVKARKGKKERQRRYLDKKNALKDTILSCFREFLETIVIKTSRNESPERWLPGSSSIGPLIDLPQKIFSDSFLSFATNTVRHGIMRKVWAGLDSELQSKRLGDRDLPRRRIWSAGKRQRCPVYLCCRFPNIEERTELEPLERFLLKYAAFLRVPVPDANRLCFLTFASYKLRAEAIGNENPGSHPINGVNHVTEVFRAKNFYEQAIAKGRDVAAMYSLAMLLEDSTSGVAKDLIRAKELYEQAIAEGTHVGAMNNLAVLLEDGANGVSKNPIRAKDLYEQAIAEGRHVGAMYNLAVLLEDGANGVQKNPIRAKELYEQAIAEGRHVGAMNNLAILLQTGATGVGKEPIRAKELYERAIAEGGHVKAMYNLAVLLEDGANGVQKDPIRAKELYEQAIAEGRHVGAMYNLAVLLKNGAAGVAKDPIHAK